MKLSNEIEQAVTQQKLKQLQETKLAKDIEETVARSKLKGAQLEESITREIEKAIIQKEELKELEAEMASQKILDAEKEKDLAKEIESASKKAVMQERLKKVREELNIIGVVLKNRVVSLGNKMKLGLKDLPAKIKSLPSTISSMDFKKLGQNLYNTIKGNVKKGFSWLGKSEGVSIIKDFGKDFVKVFTAQVSSRIASVLGNKIKEHLINAGRALVETINNSLDDLNLTDKLTSMYGDAGLGVRDRAYHLANKLGESSSMVGEMSARAAYQGIGTKDFERIMLLADKIGKLSISETTESAASTLLQNVKSGHDASTISQLFGGGELMERRLRRAGYERALNRGDLNKALEIAEKIADKAGLTDEKYRNATDTMSQNFKKIENFVTNLKHRMSELYTQQFEPIVKKITELIENKNFNRFLRLSEEGVKKVGQFVNWLLEILVDNLHIIGAFLGVGIIAKAILIVRNLGGIVGMLGMAKGVLFWIGEHVVGLLGRLGLVNASLGFSGLLGKLKQITALQLKSLAIEKARALIKPLGIGLGIGAAVAAATAVGYSIYKLKGGEKDFAGFLDGLVAAAWQGWMDFFTNIAIAFENYKRAIIHFIVEPIKLGIYSVVSDIQDGVQGAIEWIKEKIADLYEWIANGIKKLSSIDFDFNFNVFGKNVNLKGYQEQFKKFWGVGLDDIADTYSNSSTNIRDQLGVTSKWGDNLRQKKNDLENYRDTHDWAMEFVNPLTSMKNAFEKGTNGVIDAIYKNIRVALGIKDNTGETKTNTADLVKLNEQEEELRWLKAFSDRQIMSQYNNSTSTVLNTTFNGASEQLQRHGVNRLGRRARPSKAAAI
jgi:hypothetical protein